MSDYDGSEHLMVPGALRGYRVWEIELRSLSWPPSHPISVRLRSLSRLFTWDITRTNAATCMTSLGFTATNHDAPGSGCTCGFYAKHNLRDLEMEFGGGQPFVWGSIKAHGRVILSTKGFRAQYADVEAFYASRELVPYLEGLGVPVYSNRTQFLADFPPIPVDHLLPPKPEIGACDPIFAGMTAPQVTYEEAVKLHKLWAALVTNAAFEVVPQQIEKEQSE